MSHPFEETLVGSTPNYTFTRLTVGGEHCNHCGRPIKYLCHIEDARGQEYIVGTTCVEKTNDVTIGKPMKHALDDLRKKMRHNKKVEERARRRRERFNNKWSPIMEVLGNTPGKFARSVLEGLRNEVEPKGRGVEICCKIYAESLMKKGSDFEIEFKRMQNRLMY